MESKPSLLVVEDDPDDRVLLMDALLEANIPCTPQFVTDGEALLAKLQSTSRLPRLILLDLNLPGKDGRQLLIDLKTNPHWAHIPIVILTTSQAEEDVKHCYKHGANSYLVKPHSFTLLVELLVFLEQYWFNLVTLPSSSSG